jgi:hypothetical protein
MRRLILAVIFLAWAATARAGVDLDEYDLMSFTGGYYGTKTTMEAPFDKGIYRIGARARTFRFTDGARGTDEEYSAQLTRELYHATVKGRLGTSPPNLSSNGRTWSYHLAQGEAWFTFYGLTLGPEHPELSPLVWESSGTAPAAASLDRTWVGRLGMVYTNTDIHMLRPPTDPPYSNIVIENTWQFEFRETWRDRLSLALQLGGDRDNPQPPQTRGPNSRLEGIQKANIDFPGGVFAVSGWPNNWVGFDAWQRYGAWKLSEGFTRLNLLDDKLAGMYGVELEYSLAECWRLRSGYFRARPRGDSGREAATLGVNYLW